MRCVCGAKFPEDEEGNVISTLYPILPQKVTLVDDKGNRISTWETHIVKCEAETYAGKSIHPDGTEYNYVEHAKLRDGKPARVIRSRS